MILRIRTSTRILGRPRSAAHLPGWYVVVTFAPSDSLGLILSPAGPFDRGADRLGRIGRDLALDSRQNLKMTAEVILKAGDRSLTIFDRKIVDQAHHLIQCLIISSEGVAHSRVVSRPGQGLCLLEPLVRKVKQKRRITFAAP